MGWLDVTAKHVHVYVQTIAIYQFAEQNRLVSMCRM